MTWFCFSWITILGTTIATRCGEITERTVNTSLTTFYLNCSRKRGANLHFPTPCKYDFSLHNFSLHGFVFSFLSIFSPSMSYHNFCIYSKLCVNSLLGVFVVSIFPIFSEPNSAFIQGNASVPFSLVSLFYCLYFSEYFPSCHYFCIYSK